MKRTISIGFAITLILLPVNSYAQSLSDSLFYIYTVWNAEQRKAMLAQMNLTPQEAPGFCQVYDSYNRAVEYIEMENLHMLNRLARHRGQLKENDIMWINLALAENALNAARLRKQYFRKFQKVLSPSRVNEFMSLDECLRTLFHLNVLGSGTLIGKSQSVIFSTNARLHYRGD